MSSVKESLIDRWNRLARKRIYINDSFEIGVGRLVYAAIVFGVQLIWGASMVKDGNYLVLLPSLLTWLAGLKQKKDV